MKVRGQRVGHGRHDFRLLRHRLVWIQEMKERDGTPIFCPGDRVARRFLFRHLLFSGRWFFYFIRSSVGPSVENGTGWKGARGYSPTRRWVTLSWPSHSSGLAERGPRPRHESVFSPEFINSMPKYQLLFRLEKRISKLTWSLTTCLCHWLADWFTFQWQSTRVDNVTARLLRKNPSLSLFQRKEFYQGGGETKRPRWERKGRVSWLNALTLRITTSERESVGKHTHTHSFWRYFSRFSFVSFSVGFQPVFVSSLKDGYFFHKTLPN